MKISILWICNKVMRKVAVSKDAIYSFDNGWICDCGNWVKDNDGNHKVIKYGNRAFL